MKEIEKNASLGTLSPEISKAWEQSLSGKVVSLRFRRSSICNKTLGGQTLLYLGGCLSLPKSCLNPVRVAKYARTTCIFSGYLQWVVLL